MKTFTFREWIKLLERNGYVRDHATGSHITYVKGNDKIVTTNNKINKMLAWRLIKEHKLEVRV